MEMINTKQTLTGQPVPIGIILHNCPVVRRRETDNFSGHASTENKLMSKKKKTKTSCQKEMAELLLIPIKTKFKNMQIFLVNSNRRTADQPRSYCQYIHTQVKIW